LNEALLLDIHLPTWIRGRVALVGDSAHGMHPNILQGADSAFESDAAIVEQNVQTQ
jgi:2-polyprenyl-6-methoxyphenol hydroxylase-like FAD-dependent oxidoreductase